MSPSKRTSTSRRLGIVLGLLVASFFSGTIVVSIGVGSAFTGLNTVMSPLVCPGETIIPVWTYRWSAQIANGPDLSTRWICVNKDTGKVQVVGYRTILTAGTVYGLILMITFVAAAWRLGAFAPPTADKRRR